MPQATKKSKDEDQDEEEDEEQDEEETLKKVGKIMTCAVLCLLSKSVIICFKFAKG